MDLLGGGVPALDIAVRIEQAEGVGHAALQEQTGPPVILPQPGFGGPVAQHVPGQLDAEKRDEAGHRDGGQHVLDGVRAPCAERLFLRHRGHHDQRKAIAAAIARQAPDAVDEGHVDVAAGGFLAQFGEQRRAGHVPPDEAFVGRIAGEQHAGGRRQRDRAIQPELEPCVMADEVGQVDGRHHDAAEAAIGRAEAARDGDDPGTVRADLDRWPDEDSRIRIAAMVMEVLAVQDVAVAARLGARQPQSLGVEDRRRGSPAS